MSYLLLALGFVLLVGAGDLLVRGAAALAERLCIPPVIIGLTVVAFGTSAPELFVSVGAVVDGAPAIAVGNAVGSNIANILLVLGLPAMIQAIDTHERGIALNTAFMIAVSIIFVALCWLGPLSYPHGAVLIALLGLFIWYSVRNARRARRDAVADDVGTRPKSAWLIAGFIAAGLIGLPIAAEITVEGARQIAQSWGVSEAAIGLTVVAVGTSLPEIAASLMAAIRREHALAVGNVIGSNIFNLAGVMGLTALILPVPIAPGMLNFDLWIMIAAALLLLPFVLGEHRIGRFAGIAFIAMYAAYTAFVFSYS